MADKKQGADLSSGSSAAVHKAHSHASAGIGPEIPNVISPTPMDDDNDLEEIWKLFADWVLNHQSWITWT